MEKYKDYDEDEVEVENVELDNNDSDTSENYRPRAETIRAIQDGDVNQKSVEDQESLKNGNDKIEGLDETETNYNSLINDNKSAEVRYKAEKAVKEDVEEKISKGDILDHATSYKGVASEAAACETIGDNACNLNDYKRNFKNYDITSESEIASVKTHGTLEGELNSDAIERYKKDFKNINKNSITDAENILEAKDAGYPMPEGIEKAKTSEEAAEYLNKESVLRIPNDHVEIVRQEVANEMAKFPENYNLQEDLNVTDIDKIVNERIKPLGLEQKDILEIAIEEKHETKDIDQEIPKNFKPEAETIAAMQDVQKSKGASEWGQAELQNVEVLIIDTSESDKILQFTPDMLKTPEYQHIKDELYKLNDVIMPAVENGKGKDYFKELDRREGHPNFVAGGYEDIYDRFYGHHQRGIRLTKADGEILYNVDRGHEYVAAADVLGISKLPASVLKL